MTLIPWIVARQVRQLKCRDLAWIGYLGLAVRVDSKYLISGRPEIPTSLNEN